MYMPNLQGLDIWPIIISDYKGINALIMYLMVWESSFMVTDVNDDHIITHYYMGAKKN